MVGSWSDRIGRKLPLVIGCIGMALGSLCFVLSTSPWIPSIAVFVLGCCIRGLFCTATLTRVVMYTFVADTTEKADRTIGMSNLLAVNFIGLFIGSFFSGVIMEIGDFSIEFAIITVSLCIYAASILLLMPYDKPALLVNDKSSTNSCTLNDMKDAFYCLLRKRDGNGRRYILASICTLILQQCFRAAEQDVLLLYIKRQGMSQSASMFGYLLAAGDVSSILMAFVGVPIISGRMKMSDHWCVLIGTTFLLIKIVILSLSYEIWMLFLAFILCSPRIMTVSATKSMISKIVNRDENGKIIALISSIEAISSVVGSTLIALLYQYTAHIYPGIIFIFESALLAAWLPALYFSIRGYGEYCANGNAQETETQLIFRKWEQEDPIGKWLIDKSKR